MLTRTMVLFSLGLAVALFGASSSDAQPGKGGFGKAGGSAAAETQKLEKELERLREQVKETEAKLAKSKEGRGGKGKGADFKKMFEGKKDFGKGKGADFKKMFEGKKDFGPKGLEGKKLDPNTIKEKYEFYKKLYDESKRGTDKDKRGTRGKEGFGPKGFESKKKDGPPFQSPLGKGGPGGLGKGAPAGNVEARIDRLIRELEELRSEVKGRK